MVLSLGVCLASLTEIAQRRGLDNEVLIETEPFQDRFGVDRVRACGFARSSNPFISARYRVLW